MNTSHPIPYMDAEEASRGSVYPVAYQDLTPRQGFTDSPYIEGYGWSPLPNVWAVTTHNAHGKAQRIRIVDSVIITGPPVNDTTEELTIEGFPIPESKKKVGAQWTTDDIREWAAKIPKWTVFTDRAGRVITVNAEGSFQGPGLITDGQHTLRNWGDTND